MSDSTAHVLGDTATVADNQHIQLAQRLEQARSALLTLLLDHNQVAAMIARRLIQDLNKGVDCSDIIVIKNSESYKTLLQMFAAGVSSKLQSEKQLAFELLPREYGDNEVVQEFDDVQVNGRACTDSSLSLVAVHELMYSLHFLPVFLIETSAIVIKSNDLAIDDLYRRKVERCRAELKNLRQQMIANNNGLVAFVAHKYKINSLSFDDLMQEGLVGLIKAVDRFDPARGICFSTYAIYWIRQAISRLIVKQDKVVPLPVALAEKASVVFEAMRNSYLQKERWPTLSELKQSCDLSEQEIKTISSYYQATHTLDASAQEEDDNMEMMEKMQQQQFSLPLEQLIDSDLVQYMDKAVASLPEKQAAILAMRFGLKNHTEMTLQAVADHLNVTRERVRQIQNEALKKLKHQFGFDLMLFLEPKDS